MLRNLLTTALIAVGLAAVPLAGASPASAAPSGLPPGFEAITYDAGMFQYDLTNVTPLPGSTSLLATGKSGRITRVDIAGDGLSPADASSTILGNIPDYYQGDRGVLGISLAADYATTGHVFLLWDYCLGKASDDQQCIPDGGQPTGRLSRFTLTGPPTAPTGIDFTSEVVLMDNLPSWSPTPGATCTDSHTIGTVVTAPDGTLFVGNGDGSGYCGSLDPSSLSAQDVTSPRGKIFHITEDGKPTGDDIPGSYQGSVWAYGLRNPFRFSYSNGALMVGDVGWNTWEEQDVVRAGNNMGWPCLEGTDATTTGFYGKGICATNQPQFVGPAIVWSHFEPGRPAQSAAVGGVFYQGTSYPQAYQGQYFFGDYARGDLFVGDHQHPLGNLGSWSGLDSIQDGGPTMGHDLLVTDIGAAGPGKITRIHYVGGSNQLPTVSLTSSTATGLAPLAMQFHATAADADGQIVGYAWDFGDGTTATGQAVVNHTYTTPGSYQATVTVTDNNGGTAAAVQAVNVGNNLPVLTVVPPTGTFHIGDPITVQAAATDPDGDTVTLDYQPVIHHCPTPDSCHVHPGAFQTSPNFTFPSHGDDSNDYYLEIVVRATDSRGGVTTQSLTYRLADTVVPNPPPDQPPPTIPAPPPVQGLHFTPQAPQRLLDTRQDGHLPFQTPLALNLIGHKAAMLTVTVTNPVGTGYLRVYPCDNPGDGQTSTVNYNADQTISNVTIVNIPANGQVCLWSLQTTDAIVDLSGYFDPAGLGYSPIDPLRVLDSRNSFPFGAMQQVVFNLQGQPAGTQAVMANLTVTDPQAAGFLRAYPCGAEDGTANVNYDAGQTIANFAAIETPGGTTCLRSYAQTDLITDVNGYFTNQGGLGATIVDPARLFDTRSTPGFTRLVGGRESRILLGLPAGTQAAVLNVTVADPSAAGYLSVYPCGANQSNPTSNVNYVAHQTAAANMTVVKVPANGQVCFRSFADTDLIVDLSGWFS